MTALLSPIVDELIPSVSDSEAPVCCSASDKGATRVGENRLSDSEREDAIKRAGEALIKHYRDWAMTGCFAALGDAHRAEALQRQLILGRSAAQVARMERERGLA